MSLYGVHLWIQRGLQITPQQPRKRPHRRNPGGGDPQPTTPPRGPYDGPEVTTDTEPTLGDLLEQAIRTPTSKEATP